MTTMTAIRPCRVGGLFYPDDAGELRRVVSSLIERVHVRRIGGRIVGLISPHAGYVYSGYTAAHAFSLLGGARIRTVVIVSPSHREYFDGVSVYPGEAYETPLGRVTVDAEMRERLLTTSSIVTASHAGHGEEHAIEVQIPFLQCLVQELMILPIVMGDQRREYCMELGRALSTVVDPHQDLLVASTDLSHYHTHTAAEKLDSVMIEDVKGFDAEGLMTHLETGSTEACGGGPAVAVMGALKLLGVPHMKVLHHCNSGDISGDRNQVVGYLSAAAHA